MRTLTAAVGLGLGWIVLAGCADPSALSQRAAQRARETRSAWMTYRVLSERRGSDDDVTRWLALGEVIDRELATLERETKKVAEGQ